MKVFVLAPRENWIVDRFVQEWYESNSDISTQNIQEADIIWLLADWCWNQVPPQILQEKTVVCTVWHLVPEKFNKAEWDLRECYVDFYHAPSVKSMEQIRQLAGAQKPIWSQLPWVNSDIWFPMENKTELRLKYGLDENSFVIGSFQRDTEGHDLISPKLEKGPDQFCDAVQEIYAEGLRRCSKPVHVLLGAWRRQYVMKRLSNSGIPYTYVDRPSSQHLNEMYNCLDLYIVASRFEGGPQSIVECAATRTPVISTDVGLASQILHPASLFDPNIQDHSALEVTPDTKFAFRSVEPLLTPDGFTPFRTFFQGLAVS
ncbi:glycosyltransferase [Candidatus Bathyarchaeota archaeon]|jgi:glycosyltransferase involved in cell wall biosynthesis|nr:glycosyltransferase [Candidatus Bathyarchaeota archaeon]